MPTTMTAPLAQLHASAGRAILAPSVHNTQPWRFVLRNSALEVRADRGRQLAVLDPDGRQLYLSLGCALMNARVSLAAAGCSVQVVRVPDPDHPDLVAQLVPDGLDAIDPELAVLAPVIELRQTNRRRFTEAVVPADLIARLIEVAAAEGAVLHHVGDFDDRLALARLSQKADIAQITDPAYRAELRAWTNGAPGRRDGVRAAVVPHVDGTSGDEVPIRDFDTTGAGWLPAQTQSSAQQCLLVLGTASDTPHAWVRAGEALERVWLEVTRAGFVASVFTQVVEVGGVREELRHELRLGVHPHVVLRVGRAAVTAATMRRHLDEVLEVG